MKLRTKEGFEIGFDPEKGILINGKEPHYIEELGYGWYKAIRYFCRVKSPAKAASIRKRKKAVALATKRFKFSFVYKKG